MNDPTLDNLDFTLLARYLSGEASPEEAMEVDDWIMQSEKNRLLFEQVSATWQRMGNVPSEASLTSLQTPSQTLPQTPSLPSSQASSLTSTQPSSQALTQTSPQAPSQASPKAPSSTIQVVNPYKRTITIYRVGMAASLLALSVTLWLLVRSPRQKPSGNISSNAISYVTKWAHKGFLRDTLPDNSIVIQNKNSVLQYSSDFNTGSRELHLAGEAWFDVAPNKAKPFRLNIGDLHVLVLGTSFNVQQSPARIEISVKSGSVKLSIDSDSLIVKAGQQGIYDIKENKFLLLNSFNINDQAYATKILNFENSTLKEIAGQLERAYGIRVVFLDEKLKDLTMSSSFDNNSIAYIFEVISITLHVNYKINNNVVYISSS